MATACRATICAVESLEGRELFSTYYVSTSGSDSNPGSQAKPWKTVARAGSGVKANDAVYFQGGQTFGGGIYLPSTRTNVTIGSYGAGRATISSGGKTGLDVAQHAAVTVSNINFKGGGGSVNGIYIHMDRSQKASKIRIDSVDVGGYGVNGIFVNAGATGSGFSDVRITNANVHDNRENGVKINAKYGHGNTNIYLGHVRAYNSPGTGTTGKVTGSGIFIAGADNVTVDRCVAFNNGQRGAAPVGIWFAGVNRGVIQHSEAYNNHTMTSTDGGGFDFDGGTSNSVMQYNYAHNNDGPGFLLAAGTNAGHQGGNTVRYNVSQNDGRKNGRGGIHLWGEVINGNIYNNTVYMNASGSNSPAFFAHGNGGATVAKSTKVRNNIFYVKGAPLAYVAGDVVSKGSMSMDGNAYYAEGAFKIQYAGYPYASLGKFQSKGQESHGLNVNPKLTAPGTGGTFGNADSLAGLTAYKLQAGSPLINRGVATSSGSFAAFTGTVTDFFGSKLIGTTDIGADEF